MEKYRWIIIFFLIVGIVSLACTKTVTETPFPIALTTEISPTITLTCTIIPPKTVSAKVNVEIGLNLREAATENSKSLYVLKNGDIVKVVGVMENGWSCVEFTDSDGNFYSGYVNSRYISIANISLTFTPEK